ncbi:hypothetical protein HPB51_028969 [Rhipicephalus microplus]|uniref:Uncharacterized protein n=1 Tax=Rhipicephalus microplus TaxID=6941 RepID=A0A9J6CW70_RHIMP|nr:hypothetical protein HPB51_028969 [Rhipicephalus microplus]
MGPPLALSAQVACLPAALPLPPIDAERFLEAGLPYDDCRPDIERLRERSLVPSSALFIRRQVSTSTKLATRPTVMVLCKFPSTASPAFKAIGRRTDIRPVSKLPANVAYVYLLAGQEVYHSDYAALLEYEEEQGGLRAVPKLTKTHVSPNAFQKLSVRLAVQTPKENFTWLDRCCNYLDELPKQRRICFLSKPTSEAQRLTLLSTISFVKNLL